MVTFLLITASVIFIILGIVVYYRQKSAPHTSEQVLPPQPDLRSLFSNTTSSKEDVNKLAKIEADQRARLLIERARRGDHSVLREADSIVDAGLYDQALTELVQRADSDSKLLALMSFVSRNELPVNETLARAVMGSWQRSPDRNGTAKALHFAALSDDARLYGEAVDNAMTLWRGEKLKDISPTELRTLFEGEFWVLSSRTRSSGAGFVVKQTLANARRELEEATRADK